MSKLKNPLDISTTYAREEARRIASRSLKPIVVVAGTGKFVVNFI